RTSWRKNRSRSSAGQSWREASRSRAPTPPPPPRQPSDQTPAPHGPAAASSRRKSGWDEPDGAAPGRLPSLVRAAPPAQSSPSAPRQSSVSSSSSSRSVLSHSEQTSSNYPTGPKIRGHFNESAVVTNGLQALQDLFAHLLWGPEGEGLLFVNGTPKTELVSVLTLQCCGIHAARLHRIKNIQSDFNQFRNDPFDFAIGMVSDSKSAPWLGSHWIFWTERRWGGMVKVARASRRSGQAGKTTKLVKVAR